MNMLRIIAFVICAVIIGAIGSASEAADGVVIRSKAARYADVRQDLEDAIINAGLKIDFVGHVSAMLERTGRDIGATKPIYKSAEYLTFCSAKLAHASMAADPVNLAVCPYVVFVYERVEEPGRVYVGYRRPPNQGPAPDQRTNVEIDNLLDRIIKEATK